MQFPVPVTLQSMQQKKLSSLGAKVVTVSDSTGWVYDPEGIDVAALKEIKEVNRARLTEYKKYRPNSEYHEGTRRMDCQSRYRSSMCNTERTALRGCKGSGSKRMPGSLRRCKHAYYTGSNTSICRRMV